ncbi:MAG: antitoxin VapB family protein [Thermoplasmata archaeon]
MVTKTITVTEEAYKALAKEKKEGESFSELALRLTKKGKIKDCFGTWMMTKDELKIFSSLKGAWKAADKEFRERLGID